MAITFRDLDGQTWTIEPSYATFAVISRKCHVKLHAIEKFAEHWVRLLTDDDLALQVVWAAIESSADGGAFDGWLAVMDGCRLEEARTVLVDALCECYPRQAPLFREAAKTLETQLASAMAQSCAIIHELPLKSTEEMQRMADRLRAAMKG